MTDLFHDEPKPLRELLEQRDRLDEQIAAARDAERAPALEQAKALIHEFEFTAFELGLIKTKHLPPGKHGPSTFPMKHTRPPAPPKYRDPATGATWSGRGKHPRWMTEDPDAYLIRDPQ